MNIDPTIKLKKVGSANGVPASDSVRVEETSTNVIVDGRLLIERTAFLGHSFLPEDVPVVSFFKDFLNEMMVKCSSGERPELKQVHEKVKKRILDANLLVGLFTRRDKIEGKDQWRTTDWVVEEMSFAAANGKQLLILREKGVADFGGLQGNQEYIEFDRDALHLSAIKLVQALWSLNPGRFKFQSNKPPEIGIEVLRMAADANPAEPITRVVLAQQLQKVGQAHSALKEIETVLATFPTYSTALYVKAKCLRACGKLEAAQSVLLQLADVTPSDPNVHHDLGHVFSDLGNILEAEKSFALAEDCGLADPRHYKCHADLLVRTAKGRPEKLRKALDLYQTACELGGEKWEESLKKQVTALKKRIDPKRGQPQRSRRSAGRRKKLH